MSGNMIKFRSGELTRIKGNMPLKMLITNTKVARNTKALVAGVLERTLRHPSAMNSVFSAVDSISNELASIIQSPVKDGIDVTEKEEKLAELMEMNQGLLQCMGVSHVSIETVIRTTLKYKLSTKLTGAGGGGCVLTLLPSCILFGSHFYLHGSSILSSPAMFLILLSLKTFAFNLTTKLSVLSETITNEVIEELESCGFQCLIAGIGGGGVEINFNSS